MATSYDNAGGKGNRAHFILVSTTIGWGNPGILVTGAYEGGFYIGGAVAGLAITFDFSDLVVVDEATWYQDNAASHGEWKWQGSNDASTWSDVGSSFTAGGSSAQVQTSLAGNTTAYRYYRLLGVSGWANSGPYITEVEFKIVLATPPPTYSYYNYGGVGARNLSATASPGLLQDGSASDLFDGQSRNSAYFVRGITAGKYFQFEFPDATVITELTFIQRSADAQGTWQLQGSNDDTTWTAAGSPFAIAAATRQVLAIANTTQYKKYRLTAASDWLNNDYIYEILLKTGSGAPAPAILEGACAVLGSTGLTLSAVALWSAALSVHGTGSAVFLSDTPWTSYDNPGGRGDRRYIIQISVSADTMGGRPSPSLIDGALGTEAYLLNLPVADKYIQFTFPDPVIVDEVTWKQDAAATHGTWKWQGSNDGGTTWTDVGSSFTLGGATVQVQDALAGNTSAYLAYRLVGVAGNSSSIPDIQEVEFKLMLGSDATSSYLRPGGQGARQGLVAAESEPSGVFATGTLANLTDGVTANTCYFVAGPVAGVTLEFTFLQRALVTEITWIQSDDSSHGTWQFQGSDDAGAHWADIGGTFILGGATIETITAPSGNFTSYRQYRLLGVSGNKTADGYLYEIMFKLRYPPVHLAIVTVHGATALTLIAAAVWSALVSVQGTSAVLVAGGVVWACVVTASGVAGVAIVGTAVWGAAVEMDGSAAMICITTLGGVYIHCYTGGGEPVVPTSRGRNYVF